MLISNSVGVSIIGSESPFVPRKASRNLNLIWLTHLEVNNVSAGPMYFLRTVSRFWFSSLNCIVRWNALDCSGLARPKTLLLCGMDLRLRSHQQPSSHAKLE